MVIAALVCFAVLLLAWVLAPDERLAAAEPHATFEPELEAELAPAA